MPQAIIYPQQGSGGSNVSVDGRAWRGGASESFATIRAGVGTSNDNSGSQADMAILQSTSTSNLFATLVRGYLTFDTSYLGLNAIIDSASLSLWFTLLQNALGSPNLNIAGASLTSANAIVNADYQNAPARTVMGSLVYANGVTNQYNVITLNQQGKANINPTGITQFSLQLDWDLSNNFTGAWASLGNSGYTGSFSEDGLAHAPTLTVNYTQADKVITTGNTPQPNIRPSIISF